MKRVLPAFWLICFLLLPQPVRPQDASKESLLYLNVYFELQRLKTEKEEKLKRLEADIARVQQKLKETNALLAEIQRMKSTGTDKEKNEALMAEPHALNALRNAKEALDSLNRQKTELQMAIDRLNAEEKRLEDLRNKLGSGEGAGLVRDCQGDVKIVNTKIARESSCSSFMAINEGDFLITGANGRAKAVILDGRGECVLGPSSELVFKKRTHREETLELSKGKMYVHVEPRGHFLDRIKDLLQKKKEELEENLQELRIWYCEYRRKTTGKHCLVPKAILGVRGTKFSYEVTEEGTKLYVYEGTVEVSFPGKGQTFAVSEGFRAEIRPDGSLIQEGIGEAPKWWDE